MIQRVQTLLWLEVAFLSISLLFVPVQTSIMKGAELHVYLMPLKDAALSSSIGHYAAIVLNFLAMVVCFLAIFNFKKRDLQIKLSYVLAILFAIIAAMIAFCPLTAKSELVESVRTNIFSYIICGVAIISSFVAARFVKKDIELLKSADRIR